MSSHRNGSDRNASLSSTGLENVFAIENFTATTTSTSTTPTSTPVEAESTSTKTDVGAMAGGVVGGVVHLAIVGGLAFFFLRRRNRAQAAATKGERGDRPPLHGYKDADSVNRIAQELPQSKHDHPAAAEANGQVVCEANTESLVPQELAG